MGSGAGAVPSHWLLPSKPDCNVDSIDAVQFKWDVFLAHYLRHRRPLLVRRAAHMDGTAINYARDQLLQRAGDRILNTFDVPYADGIRGDVPISMALRDYTAFLSQRLHCGAPANNLSYIFVRVPEDDVELGFTTELPGLFRGRVRPRSTQFTVGGVLMGSPMHHHIHAVNSLMYGRKLWFLKLPAEQEFRKTVIYEDLVASDGAPGVVRCVQEAGDLLFVPSGWIHGVLCLCDCVGVAHEFDPLEWEFNDCDMSDLELLDAEDG